jgi:hypothetical protein
MVNVGSTHGRRLPGPAVSMHLSAGRARSSPVLSATSAPHAGSCRRSLADSRATVPLLLANLTSVSQVTDVYLEGLQQMLVTFPADVDNLTATTRAPTTRTCGRRPPPGADCTSGTRPRRRPEARARADRDRAAPRGSWARRPTTRTTACSSVRTGSCARQAAPSPVAASAPPGPPAADPGRVSTPGHMTTNRQPRYPNAHQASPPRPAPAPGGETGRHPLRRRGSSSARRRFRTSR